MVEYSPLFCWQGFEPLSNQWTIECMIGDPQVLTPFLPIDKLLWLQVNLNMEIIIVFCLLIYTQRKQQVTINTTGHNPKDIKVDVTDTEIKITSKKGENTSRFVSDIDLTLTVGKDYDGTKTEAKFENGLLTLLIDKKEDKKTKSLKISY